MKDSLNIAIKAAGGVAALAAAVNAPSTHAVRWWRTSRVPAEYCPSIEAATGVRCEELRPDVQWGVLRGTNCEQKTNPAQSQHGFVATESAAHG